MVDDRWQHPLLSLEQEATDIEHSLDKFAASNPVLADVLAGLSALSKSILISARSLRETPEQNVLMFREHPLPMPRDLQLEILDSDLFRPFVELSLANEALAKAIAAQQRLADLLKSLVTVKLSDAPSYYLGRVAHLYLWGFSTEVAAFARAALETAIRDKMSDDDVRNHVTVRGKFIQLDERIEAAYQVGLLSEIGANLADDIRDAGNDILHFAPKPRSGLNTPLDVVRGLAVFLQQLYEPSDSTAGA